MAPCTAMQPKICELPIDIDGRQAYKVTIDTADGKEDGTTVPIHLTLIGDKAKAQAKIISEKGIKAGDSKTFNINTTPIGKVVGFELALESKGKWKPIKVTTEDVSKYIILIKIATKERIDFFT